MSTVFKWERAEGDLSKLKAKCLEQGTALEANQLATSHLTTQLQQTRQHAQKLEWKLKAVHEEVAVKDQKASDSQIASARTDALNE